MGLCWKREDWVSFSHSIFFTASLLSIPNLKKKIKKIACATSVGSNDPDCVFWLRLAEQSQPQLTEFVLKAFPSSGDGAANAPSSGLSRVI